MPPTRSSRPRSPSSTRSPISASRSAPTCRRSRAASASTTASARSSCMPGRAIGGSCFPKDTLALIKTAQDHDAPMRIVETVAAVNDSASAPWRARSSPPAAARCAARRSPCSASPSSPTPTTCATRRRSPLITALQDGGRQGARLRSGRHGAGEGCARRRRPTAQDPYDCAAGADALVIVTEWDMFRALDLDRLKASLAEPGHGRPAQHLPPRRDEAPRLHL